MCWHRLESAGALDVRRPDGIVMRAEIHGAFAQAAWPADYVQTFATHPPGESFMTALLLGAVARWRLFATGAFANGSSARVARPRGTKWADATCE